MISINNARYVVKLWILSNETAELAKCNQPSKAKITKRESRIIATNCGINTTDNG